MCLSHTDVCLLFILTLLSSFILILKSNAFFLLRDTAAAPQTITKVVVVKEPSKPAEKAETTIDWVQKCETLDVNVDLLVRMMSVRYVILNTMERNDILDSSTDSANFSHQSKLK